jgi:ribosomal protein S27E
MRSLSATGEEPVGVGIYENDSSHASTTSPIPRAAVPIPRAAVAVAVAASQQQIGQPAAATVYQSSTPQPFHHVKPMIQAEISEISDGSAYGISAPYQGMMLGSDGREDPAVERARTSMILHKDKAHARMPFPKAGVPQEPTAQAMEPTVPASRLGRRCLTERHKREPDVVKGRVVPAIPQSEFAMSNGVANGKFAYVECANCGALLQISKNAIVVICSSCAKVHHTASCRIPLR